MDLTSCGTPEYSDPIERQGFDGSKLENLFGCVLLLEEMHDAAWLTFCPSPVVDLIWSTGGGTRHRLLLSVVWTQSWILIRISEPTN